MNFKNTYRGQGKVRIDGKKVLLDQGVSQVLAVENLSLRLQE